MQEQGEDLEKFLKNVDEISALVKDLNSSECGQAMEKADRLIESWKEEEPCTTRVNRTVINSTPSQREAAPTDIQNDSDVCSENFRRILEKDAEARAKSRKEKEVLANALKAKGNEAYARGDYETAVLHYSEGLQEVRNLQALYTNRAQAYIKLQKYKEAIADCDWALRCDEKCIKALVHMGRANQALKNYAEARACYQRILDIEPGRVTLVKEYLTGVDLEEKKEVQEQGAREEFETGKETAISVKLLLEELNKPEQMNMYYCKSLDLLSQAITDCTGQTLFRLNNGFGIIISNDTIKSCLLQSSAAPLSEDLCVSVLKVWTAVCDGNEENQRFLLQDSLVKEYLVRLLPSERAEERTQCLALLCLYSQSECGRRLVIGLLNLRTLVGNLMKCLCDEDSTAELVLAVLAPLAAEKQFRILLREHFATLFLPPFGRQLGNITSSDHSLLLSLLSVMFSMTADDVICRETALCKAYWDAFLVTMGHCAGGEYTDVLNPLLGMMVKLSTSPSPTVQDYAVPISCRCLALLSHPNEDVVTRSAALLSLVLPQSPDATRDAVQGGIVKKMLKLLKDSVESTTQYCIKTLAVCTEASQQAQEELLKLDKRLQTLRKLVGRAGEVLAGNAALCLGHCLRIPGAATTLLGTDVVLVLLRCAAMDTGNTGKAKKNGSAQQNAAIALGKLCEVEPRHLLKLRELHGFEVLHSCWKQI